MGSALTVYTGDDLGRAKSWATLAPDERKRRAAEAARDRDAETLWSLTHAWITLHSSSAAKTSAHTIRAYRGSVYALIDAFRGEALLRPSPDAAALYCRQLETEGLSASTIQVRLAGARALYKALRWAGAVDSDPLADVRPARDPTPAWERRKPYPESHLTRMLAVAGPLDRALILLGSHAGLRVSEVLALRWEDLDLPARRLTVVRGKGGKTRSTNLSRSVVDALTALPHDGEHVFPYRASANARLRLALVCRDAGVPYLGCHALRHSAGTRLYRETGKLETCQTHLGHSSISTTQIYVHYSDESVKRSVEDW